MLKKILRAAALLLISGLLLNINLPANHSAPAKPGAQEPASAPALAPASAPAPAPASLAQGSVFRYPVVPGATISGYFDHSPTGGKVVHYNGVASSASGGFYFQCTNPNMYDYVGCVDPIAGEPGCDNSRELWYDGHKGTDYEFAANWHTGAYCNPGKFNGITRPIYSPARGRVVMAGTDPNRPANGWHIRIEHDLNGNGSFYDDNFRSIYLHFTANALAVSAGQIVEEGQYLGLGGSTGYSSSPHLHFEVQRSSDYFQTNVWSVDPYGWQSSGADPWYAENVVLFRAPVEYDNFTYLPFIGNRETACQDCQERLRNGGFESGSDGWVEEGVQVINQVGSPNLTVSPYQGSWLAWLGGRNSATDILYQEFQAPAGQSAGRLVYHLYVTTEESGGVYDAMTVNLRNANGELVRQLEMIDNTFSPGGQWVERDIPLSNLSAWQGQTLRVSFEAVTDSNAKTSFYIDSLSLTIPAQ